MSKDRETLEFPLRKVPQICVRIEYFGYAIALLLGLMLHFRDMLELEKVGETAEWFPSVSLIMGYKYPLKSIIQITMALIAGPRLVFVFLWGRIVALKHRNQAKLVILIGFLRTCCHLGFSNVSNFDDKTTHSRLFALYVLLGIPWVNINLRLKGHKHRQGFENLSSLAKLGYSMYTLVLLMYLAFYRHQILRVAGAFSWFAVAQWLYVLADIAFNYILAVDISTLSVTLDTGRKPKTRTGSHIV